MKKLTLLLHLMVLSLACGQAISQTQNASTLISFKDFMDSRDTITMRYEKFFFSPNDLSSDWKDIYYDTIRVANCVKERVDINGLILGNKYTKADIEAKFGTPSLYTFNPDENKNKAEEYYCFFNANEKSIGEYDTDKVGIILYFAYGRFTRFSINQISGCSIYNNSIKVGDNLNNVIKQLPGGYDLKGLAYRIDKNDVAIICDYEGLFITRIIGTITNEKPKK